MEERESTWCVRKRQRKSERESERDEKGEGYLREKQRRIEREREYVFVRVCVYACVGERVCVEERVYLVRERANEGHTQREEEDIQLHTFTHTFP